MSLIIHCYCETDHTFYCIFERQSLKPFIERFQTYLFLDDIEIIEQDLSVISIVGPNTDNVIQELGLTPPNQQMVKTGDLMLFRVNRCVEGIDIYGPIDVISSIQETASNKGVPLMDYVGQFTNSRR